MTLPTDSDNTIRILLEIAECAFRDALELTGNLPDSDIYTETDENDNPRLIIRSGDDIFEFTAKRVSSEMLKEYKLIKYNGDKDSSHEPEQIKFAALAEARTEMYRQLAETLGIELDSVNPEQIIPENFDVLSGYTRHKDFGFDDRGAWVQIRRSVDQKLITLSWKISHA